MAIPFFPDIFGQLNSLALAYYAAQTVTLTPLSLGSRYLYHSISFNYTLTLNVTLNPNLNPKPNNPIP